MKLYSFTPNCVVCKQIKQIKYIHHPTVIFLEHICSMKLFFLCLFSYKFIYKVLHGKLYNIQNIHFGLYNYRFYRLLLERIVVVYIANVPSIYLSVGFLYLDLFV